MFIKLHFTADKKFQTILRVVADIINTSSVTSVSALQTRATAASYHASLLANFSPTYSTIIRTVSPTNTKAHVACPNTTYPGYNGVSFTLEQVVYDAASTKYYVQLNPNGSASNVAWTYMAMGDSITGGTMASTQLNLSIDEADTSGVAYGTVLTLGGTPLSFTNQVNNGSSGHTTIRTFWAYITDKCFMWATTNGTSYNSGFGTTYNSATSYSGPFFFSQYTRYDYHNTDSNGIIPVMYTSPKGASLGFCNQGDYNNYTNPMYTTNSTTNPVRVYNIVSALPQVGSAWPKIYNPIVSHTILGRSAARLTLNSAQAAGTSTNQYIISTGGSITTTASQRYATANLAGTSYALAPLGWEHSYYGNHGGNMSDQCGVYIFNGDYVPGDTFTANNKVYMVWPFYYGYSDRVGFAVPME